MREKVAGDVVSWERPRRDGGEHRRGGVVATLFKLLWRKCTVLKTPPICE